MVLSGRLWSLLLLLALLWLSACRPSDVPERSRSPSVAPSDDCNARPTSKYQGQPSAGVALQIVDRDRFHPITVALHMLATARQLHPQWFAFQSELFDLLAGADATRTALAAGMPIDRIVASWQAQQAAFEPLRQRYLLYP